MRSKRLCSTIITKFNDSKADNSLKDRRLCVDLKECLPLTARTTKFSVKKGKNTVIADRKQFPEILSHTITVCKS